MTIGTLRYSGNPHLRSWRQSYAFVVLATFAVVWAADFFLYGHRLGWTAAVVAGAMLLMLAARDTRFLDARGGRVAWVATLGLLVALIEQPTWLNVLYVVVCLATLALVNAQGWDNDFVRWAGRLGRWVMTGWTRLFLDNGLAVRWLVRHGFSPTLAKGIAAWLIPVMLTCVFVAIFAWANPIISGWFSQLGTLIANTLDKLPAVLDVGRIFFWFAFAMVMWSLLRSRTWRVRTNRAGAGAAFQGSAPAHGGVDISTGGAGSGASEDWTVPILPVDGKVVREHNALGIPASMVIRCLILFNLVFAVELTTDLFVMLSQQFGSDATAFKTYVRRGAYPLVAAALLAGAFVLVTFRPKSETEQSPLARKLVYLWIGQTILLTLSAVWRLVRYVDLSELTRLRVASAIWFTLVGCGLFFIVWRIVRGRSNAWLINANAVAALAILYPCCFINFDGMIANFNARHCEEAGGRGSSLDIAYFENLGTPALPALDSVRDKLVGDARRERAKDVSARLHAELDDNMNDWRAWTWRRSRSARAARQVNDERLARARAAQPQLAQASPLPTRPEHPDAGVATADQPLKR